MKKLFSLLALTTAASLGLTACETATPYASANQKSTYGFSEQRIEQNRYRITFRGNSLTDRQTVENYLLYRAAELTLQKGYDHFIVVKQDTDKATEYTSSAPMSFYGYNRPFPYYGYGYNWHRRYQRSIANDAIIRETQRYAAIAYVVMYHGDKPSQNPAAYDASDVEQSLAGFIRRPEVK